MDQQTMETMAAEIEAESKTEAPPPAAPEAPPPAVEQAAGEAAAAEQRRMVPFEALQEERKHRQQLDADYKKLEGRLDQLNQWLSQQAKEPEVKPQPAREPEAPAFETDPAGHLKYHLDRLNQDKAKFQQHLDAQTEQAKQTEAQQHFLRAYAGQVQAFAATEPNYVPAFNHWIQARGAQHAAAGLPAEMVQRLLVDEERFIVATAMQANRNPAEAMFNVAKAIGWQPMVPAAPAPEEAPPRAPNGQFQSKAAPTPPKSLSHAAGTAGGQITAEALLTMPDKEWDAMTRDGGWAKIMRGR